MLTTGSVCSTSRHGSTARLEPWLPEEQRHSQAAGTLPSTAVGSLLPSVLYEAQKPDVENLLLSNICASETISISKA